MYYKCVCVEGLQCAIFANTHTVVMCTAPRGQGVGQELMLSVGSQTSNTRRVDYALPIIDTLTPTTGDTRMYSHINL